ncbi:MAG: transcriptional repressor [Deltaproteobacteria bacterium]|nr:transcriptional repressor [Deltaproteobacteria bacterium]
MEKCVADVLLKRNGLKKTKQRVLLLDEIIEIGKSFTAAGLFEKFCNSMDLVTIYRTLNLFEKKRIIRVVLTGDEAKYYEISCIHNPIHPHFYCTICKSVSCLDEIKEKDIINLKEYGKNCSINDISIQLSGICHRCK